MRFRRAARAARVVLLVGLFVADVGLMAKYQSDNEVLGQLAGPHVSSEDAPSETVIRLLRLVREEVVTGGTDAYFLSPVFGFLRPTACQVAEMGGDCADKSRLLITLLHLQGIRASKVALYDDGQVPRHAVVDVEIENGERMVVDAFFGLYFPRPDGGYYTVEDVSADEDILRFRIESLVSSGEDGRVPRLARYPYDRYTYRHPRTINWDKSVVTRWAYEVLAATFGQTWTNSIRRPFLVEQPVLMVLSASVSLQLVLALSFVPAFGFKSRASTAEDKSLLPEELVTQHGRDGCSKREDAEEFRVSGETTGTSDGKRLAKEG